MESKPEAKDPMFDQEKLLGEIQRLGDIGNRLIFLVSLLLIVIFVASCSIGVYVLTWRPLPRDWVLEREPKTRPAPKTSLATISAEINSRYGTTLATSEQTLNGGNKVSKSTIDSSAVTVYPSGEGDPNATDEVNIR